MWRGTDISREVLSNKMTGSFNREAKSVRASHEELRDRGVSGKGNNTGKALGQNCFVKFKGLQEVGCLMRVCEGDRKGDGVPQVVTMIWRAFQHNVRTLAFSLHRLGSKSKVYRGG